MEWYLKVLKQYADFSGRARRTEYWMFYLFNSFIPIGLMIIGGILFAMNESSVPFIICMVLVGLYSLAVFIPSLAVTVRRLHDTNHSGWMYFVSLIPIIGGIWLLILLCTDGTHGQNQYGPDPKE